jgi:hypothetical protein
MPLITPNARALDFMSLKSRVVRMYTGGISRAVPTPSKIEGRHDQQEQGDADLHALNGGVQVVADVSDHDVHVQPAKLQMNSARASGTSIRRSRRSRGLPVDGAGHDPDSPPSGPPIA